MRKINPIIIRFYLNICMKKMRFNAISHTKESGNKKEMAMTINVLHVIHFKMRILCDLYSKFTLSVKFCCFFAVVVYIHI